MSPFRPLQLLVLRSTRARGRNDAVRSFTVAFAVIAAVVAASCDKVPLTSPTGSTILLSASTNIVPIDGSAEITATVTESAGTAVQNGTTVVFRADLGRMDPQESQTVNGRAVSRFFASGLSGVVRINAYSGAAATGGSTTSGNSSTTPGAPLTILVGGAAASRITLRAEPPNIPQTGGTVQIIANVADTNGSPVQGAPVTFAIGGTGTGTGILGSPSTQTNASGVAQTSLTTNQTTTVTATVATAGATAPVTANVVVTALPAPTVTLACTNAATAAVGVAVNCTITPTVATGGTAIQNVTVNWGDGSGEQPQGNVTGITAISHVYTASGTYTVTVSATDLNGQRGTAVVTLVVQRILPTITITASATTGSVGVPMSFTVTPAPSPPQPITNVTVDFGDGTTRDLGVISSPTTVAKSYGSEGTFTVTATVTDQSGQRGNGSTQVVIGRAASPTITFTQTDFTTPANPAIPEQFSVSAATTSTGLTIRSIVVTRNSNGAVLYNGSGGGSFAALVTVNEILTATATDSAGSVSTSQLVVR